MVLTSRFYACPMSIGRKIRQFPSEVKRCIIITHLCIYLNFVLTLALAWGVDATPPPPEVFLRCTPNYEVDRAEILHSLWGILCATFGKKIDRVVSGHRAMTSQEVQGQVTFCEK